MKNIFSFLNASKAVGNLINKIPFKQPKNWPLWVKIVSGFSIIALVFLTAYGKLDYDLLVELVVILEELGRGVDPTVVD